MDVTIVQNRDETWTAIITTVSGLHYCKVFTTEPTVADVRAHWRDHRSDFGRYFYH